MANNNKKVGYWNGTNGKYYNVKLMMRENNYIMIWNNYNYYSIFVAKFTRKVEWNYLNNL